MFSQIKNIINNKDIMYWIVIVVNIVFALEDFFINKNYGGGVSFTIMALLWTWVKYSRNK